jgi:hypothetical protein
MFKILYFRKLKLSLSTMRRRIRGVEVHLHSFLTRAPSGLDYFSVSIALFPHENIVYVGVDNLIQTDLRLWSILYIKKAVGFSTYGATWRHKRQHQNPITYRLGCLISYLNDFLQCDVKFPLCTRGKDVNTSGTRWPWFLSFSFHSFNVSNWH